MNPTTDFKLTPELAKEFAAYCLSDSAGVLTPTGIEKSWNAFVELKTTSKKDWRVTAYSQNTQTKDLWLQFEHGWGRSVNGVCVTETYSDKVIAANPIYKIHTIFRLSDGEYFSVGDILEQGEIIEMNYSIWSDSVTACIFTKDFINKPYKEYYLSDLIKKQPIFITNDGFPAYEDDELFFINCKLWTSPCQIKTKKGYSSSSHPYNVYFKHKKASEVFFRDQQPRLSIADVLSISTMPDGDVFMNYRTGDLLRLIHKLRK